MNLKTRRIAATMAVVLALVFATAAATSAQAWFTPSASETPGSTRSQSVEDINRTNYAAACKIQPKWIQTWNAELDRFTWKKLWVKRCGVAVAY